MLEIFATERNDSQEEKKKKKKNNQRNDDARSATGGTSEFPGLASAERRA
jgi:hypothetical protein